VTGSTKLFQRAGSPLIQGHSRYARAFWADWARACVLGLVVAYGYLAVTTLIDPARPNLTSVDVLLGWLLQPLPGLLAMLPTTAATVWIIRRLGSTRAWIAGGILGGIVAIVVMGYAWR
jgi:hypothetical protein